MSDDRALGGEAPQEILARIIDHAPVGISYMNRELVYEWVNAAQAEQWGLPAAQVVGRSVFEVFGPDAEPQLGPLLRGVVAKGEPYFAKGFPFRIARADGERWTYWDFTYQPVKGRDGAVEGVLVLAQEVSERVENERLQAEKVAALEAADRLKDQFLAVLSHELRTPINAITGFASILADHLDGPLNAEQEGHVRKILRGASDLETLIDDMLDMGRIQAGKFTLACQPLAPTDVVDQALRAVRPAAERKGLVMVAEPAPGLPTMNADEARLAQALTNLVRNAVTYSPAGGRVAVRVAAAAGLVRFEVADAGPGIAAADVGKLFKPFGQLDAGDARRASGVGLGLSIARALVEAHGGRIGVESEPGHGATFWFEVPVAPP